MPAEEQMLGSQQIGLDEAALRRLDKAERRPDVLRVQQAKRRLETALANDEPGGTEDGA